MRVPPILGIAAAMMPALRRNRMADAFLADRPPPVLVDPPPRIQPPLPLREPRRPLPRRTPEQTTLHRMTNWQNHQWMKAGCPRGKRLQEFAELQFGHALPPKGKST